MKSHPVALLLLGLLFALGTALASATLRRKTTGGNHHQEIETHEDEITSELPALLKPGDCPRGTLPGLPRPLQAYCVEDEPCPGDQKCCRIGNIRKCVLPVGVHPGYCPRTEGDTASSKHCSWDTDCALDEQCCPREGHQRCTKAVPAKPGLCPKKRLPRVSSPCESECRDDRSCPTGQKCCFIDCGLKCVSPESYHSGERVGLDEDHDPPLTDGGQGVLPVKSGVCPKTAPPGNDDPCKTGCSKDSDCPETQKCCKIECGVACLHPLPAALPVKSGVCPTRVPPGALDRCMAGCSSDSDCPRREKCCKIECGMACLPPLLNAKPYNSTELASQSAPGFCRLPSDPGSCNASSILRVFYNSQSRRCEKFPYRGCGGNKNNFATQLECLRSCSDPEICLLPVDQGFGGAFRTRYFYNPTSRTCESFLYRGHGGNANNFWEKQDCLQFCAPHEA